MKQGEKTLPICPGVPQGNVISRLPNSSVLWICLSSHVCMDQLYLGALQRLMKWDFTEQLHQSHSPGAVRTSACLPVPLILLGYLSAVLIQQQYSSTDQNTSIVFLCQHCRVFFLRSDALWLLSSFPAQLLGVFSLLTGCFMYLVMVNALCFPGPLLL